MEYRRTNPAIVPPSAVNAVRRDRKYFREITAPNVRRIYEAMDEVLDPMEYEGSLLFDEYPDAGEILRLTDQVLSSADERNGSAEVDFDVQTGNLGCDRELVKALLCEEMCRRRFRHLLKSMK